MPHGRCLCADIRFEVCEPLKDSSHCHCSRCRHARGAAHATNIFVSRDNFRWLRGGDHVTSYTLPEAQRFGQSFCNTCGSKLPRVREGSPYAAIPAGAVDGDPGGRPKGHIYVGSKAGWYDIPDALPQYHEGP